MQETMPACLRAAAFRRRQALRCAGTRLPVELHRPIRVLWDTHERLNYGINIWGIGISSINRTIPKLFAETRRLFVQVKYERSHTC